MHILIFHQFFQTNDNPGSTRIYELARGLVQQGDSVSIVTGNSIYFTGRRASKSGLLWKAERVEGIDVIRVRIPFGGSRRIPLRILGYLWFIPLGCWVALRVNSPDVVMATSTPLSIGVPGYLLSSLRGVPFIFELRDLWPDAAVAWNIIRNRPLLWAAYRLESFLYRKAKAIIALTRGIRQEVISKGIDPDKVHVITNAANLELFSPEGPRADLAALAGVPPGSFVCMYAGAMGSTIALGLVIKAAAQLQEHSSIHFVLLGAGPEKLGLKREAEKRGLRNVHFLDPVPKSEVPRFLRAVDVGALLIEPCSLSYIFLPNKFFDYLACGCPVILNFDGEARTYVESAKAGICIPANDGSALAATIRELAVSPNRMAQMHQSARRLAEKMFGWNHKVVELREVLFSVVNPTSSLDEPARAGAGAHRSV